MNISEDRFKPDASSMTQNSSLSAQKSLTQSTKVPKQKSGSIEDASNFIFLFDALQKMSAFVGRKSLTQIVRVTTTDKKAVDFLKELHAGEIKEVIIEVIENAIQHLQKEEAAP